MAEFRRWGDGESTDEILDDGGEWWLKESIKITLFALFTALLMIGCGSPDLDDPETLDKIIAEAIDEDNFQKRSKEGEELHYAPNEQSPYTGWSKVMYDNGQIGGLKSYKDGKPDGLLTMWYENGQKSVEENYKDGKHMSAVIWKPNGDKCPVTNLKDGNGVMVAYDIDGKEMFRTTYKDGEEVED